MSNQLSGKSKGGKALAEKMTVEQRKAKAMVMVEAKKARKEMSRATNEGKLKIGDLSLDVAVLDDGVRVVTQAAIFRALDRPSRGNSRVINIPVFMDAKNLQSFIGEDLMGVINKIQYINMAGKIQDGFDATILPLVSDLYLKAREAGVITQKNQLETAMKAEILVRSLAKVGIIALVDEATGYQKERTKDALAKILEAFVAKELQPYLKTFPADYYEQLFRLYGYEFPPKDKRPQWRPIFFGKITNEVVYDRLAPEILPELKKASSKAEKKSKLFQWLTSDVGHPKLREHLASIVSILKLSKTPEEFKRNVNLVHPRYGETKEFDFDSSEN